MQDTFWETHYKNFQIHEPSDFAKYSIAKYIRLNDTVVELGCGNGRDGLALSKKAEQYIGIDSCPIAINAFKENIDSTTKISVNNINLIQSDFSGIDFDSLVGDTKRLVLFSRFTLHSITYPQVDKLFSNIENINSLPWIFLLEVRTIFDTLYGQGENIGLHEYQSDHYRRFIDPKEFLLDMTPRFTFRYFEVSTGFAPYLDQDPLIMRSVIEK